MTGGQAKGNRHLTPLMLAYILEMSTYYNESLFMFIVNVHHVLYCTAGEVSIMGELAQKREDDITW